MIVALLDFSCSVQDYYSVHVICGFASGGIKDVLKMQPIGSTQFTSCVG